MDNHTHYGFKAIEAAQGLDNLLFSLVEKTATRLHNL